jgi:UDP-galactopyranose mutase
MNVDWLIVGAGFTGSILAERIANICDEKVLLVEKRNHIAGNAYDFYDEHGILVHKYGPHIFHTNSKKVWDYLSEFTTWRHYFHQVLASIDGKQVPIPFNYNSIYSVFPLSFAQNLEKTLTERFGYGKKVSILKLLEEESEDLKFLADYVYKNVFLGYTLKQWGVKPEEIDKSVTSRVPIYLSRDNRYFQDTYQAIPEFGYTKMFQNIINHPNIKLLLNTNYKEIEDQITFKKIIYTGPLDFYFDYEFGPLPYRSLDFSFKNLKQDRYQDVAQVNYPNEFNFTRITEFKHLSGQKAESTSFVYEFPQEYEIGKNTPYYPIPNEENKILADKYKQKTKQLDNVIFAGRLADYQYYNMDQAAARALSIFEKQILSSK